MPPDMTINATQVAPILNDDARGDKMDTHEKSSHSISCKDILYITKNLKR